jgi:hypothetical protein
MKIARSVSQILDDHVLLELECIDRLYLGLYVPVLQVNLPQFGGHPQKRVQARGVSHGKEEEST